MRRRIGPLVALAWAAALLAAGCRRSEQGVFVTAPFNEETRIAKVDANWQAAHSESEREHFRFEVRVTNKLADRLFVRLGNFALTDASGAVLASMAEERGCILPASAEAVVLSGEIAVPRAAAGRVADFRVTRFGVPLSERGRAIYREFLLQSERYSEAQVDAEIAAYMRSEPCP